MEKNLRVSYFSFYYVQFFIIIFFFFALLRS